MKASDTGIAGLIAGRLSDLLSYLRSFLPFMWKNFMQDRVLLSAGSLAFQTLLSMIPLMAVVLSVLSVSPVFETFKRYVDDFLFQNFVPASGSMIREYFWEFIGNTATVPTVGGIFLLIIALFLISTVDHTINQIWDVRAPRKILQGFTLYWTVLTLGPIIIGSGLVASSYVWYTVFTEGPLLEMRTRILSYLPLVNSLLAFFLLYMLVPNHRVRFLHAVSGAFLATVLFELSKHWFSFYVKTFATFEHIYGALSVIPLLFFWIYLIWVVALSGAEFVYCLGAVRQDEKKEKKQFSALHGLRDVLAVMEHIWKGQQCGQYVRYKKYTLFRKGIDAARVRSIVAILAENRLIHVTADGEFALHCDIHEVTLFDLYSIMPPEILAGSDSAASGERYEQLYELEATVASCLRESLDKPLALYIKQEEGVIE